MANKAKSFAINKDLIVTNAYASSDGPLTRKGLSDKTTKEILEIFNANAKSVKEPERKSFKDHATAVETTWTFLQDLFGTAVEAAPGAAPAPAPAAPSSEGGALGAALTNPEKNVAKEKKEKVKKEKVIVTKTPRGTDRPYRVVAKDNPFREGTVRYDLWKLVKANASTAKAREADKKISTPFMDELVQRGYIAYTDEAGEKQQAEMASAKVAAEAKAKADAEQKAKDDAEKKAKADAAKKNEKKDEKASA